MSEDIEQEDSPNLPEPDSEDTEGTEGTPAEEGTEGAEHEYTDSEKKLYARAKKAEAEARELKAKLKPSQKEPVSPPSGTGSLTINSVREFKAISDLEDEDAEYVASIAEKFGFSLADARKNKDVQAVLSVRAEERRTASVTSTGTVRRGTSKVSDESLLEKASAGNMPEDEDSMMRIAQARLKTRKQNA